MSEQKSVIVIAGPTASGKTDFAFELALKNNTAIVSADSRQCFRELNIGVAKPPSDLLKKIPHYFVNSHSIHDDIDAVAFESYALQAIKKIHSYSDTAIVAGGTGLYIKAFLQGMDHIPEIDVTIEAAVRENFKQFGFQWLKESLEQQDALFALKGEMMNPQRMMRGLTVKLSTGKSILDFHRKEMKQRPFTIQKIFIDLPREILYARINDRVDRMMANGLESEARQLYDYRHLNALQTVGYSELFSYFDNQTTLDHAVELIKRNTRHYAKRQITWFKKYFIDGETQVIH